MIYRPHVYQAAATKHIVDTVGGSGLFLDMGLGKTVSTLTAIKQLFDQGQINKVLVVAPKRVAEHTWKEEVAKWQHLEDLTVNVCVGSEKKRKEALNAKAHLYCINRENVTWVVAQYAGEWPFDMVVLDELSSFKAHKSARFKALKTIRPQIKRIVGLTGTPTPNGLLDLWSQIYLLDKGQRLGTSITKYRERYFGEGKRRGEIVYNYEIREGDDLLGADIYQEEIYDKISDICISMKAADWLTLPERIDHDYAVNLEGEALMKYRAFEADAVLRFIESTGDEKEIAAPNAAALTGKLLQMANGAVYDEEKVVHEIHDLKLEALEEIMEAANGNPVLCFYNYKHDVDRIMKRLKAYKPHQLGGPKDIDRWNKGEFQLLLAHPASAGHGLNMQQGGNRIVWFGLPWSLELYQQAVARLDRQGQTKSVINTRIVCPGTMDDNVIQGLERKSLGQEELLAAIKAKITQYTSGV